MRSILQIIGEHILLVGRPRQRDGDLYTRNREVKVGRNLRNIQVPEGVQITTVGNPVSNPVSNSVSNPVS